MRRTALTLGAIGLAVVAGGCGDADSDAGDPKAEFISQADAICESLGQESSDLADEVFDQGESRPTRADVRRFDAESAALEEDALAQLRELEPPPGDEEVVGQMWDALEAAIDAIEAIPPSAPGNAGGPAAAALEEFEAMASEYGLTACAGPA